MKLKTKLSKLRHDGHITDAEYTIIINALHQFSTQPCEDAISREAMLKVQAKYAEDMGATKFWQMRDDIRALQPVTSIRSENEIVDDCISREAVLNKAWDVFYEGKYIQVVDIGDILDLSPVTPQKKIGHWIQSWCEWQQYLECSKCGYETGLGCDTNYCPNCGAKMEDEK